MNLDTYAEALDQLSDMEKLIRDCRTVIRNAKEDGLCNDPEWEELLQRMDELL